MIFNNYNEIPQDTLQSKTINNKETVIEQSIIKNQIQIPTQQYWQSQDTLNANIAIRNLSQSWKIKIWTFVITATWSKTITWLWFTPKVVRILATQSGWTWPIKSDWQTDWTNQYIIYDYNSTWWMRSYFANDKLIRCEDWSSGTFINTTSVITSLDTDWFTINTTNYWLPIIDCIYTCFG